MSGKRESLFSFLTRQARKRLLTAHPERREARVTDASHPSRITRRAILKEIYATCEREGRIAYKRECRSPLRAAPVPAPHPGMRVFIFFLGSGLALFRTAGARRGKRTNRFFRTFFRDCDSSRLFSSPSWWLRRLLVPTDACPLLSSPADGKGSRLLTANEHWKSQIRHALYTSPRFKRVDDGRLGPCQTPKPRLRNPSR